MATVRLYQLVATIGGTRVRLYQLQANVPPDTTPPVPSNVARVRLFQFAAQATPVGVLTAYAGVDRQANAFDIITLDGSGSPGAPDTYTWLQIAGPTVAGASGPGPTRTFIVPGDPLVTTTYTFRLTVTNVFGSAADTVSYTVPPHPFRVLTPSGWKPRPLYRIKESTASSGYSDTYSDTY